MSKPPALARKPRVFKPNPVQSGAHKRTAVEILERLVPSFPVFPGLERCAQVYLKGRGKPEGPRK